MKWRLALAGTALALMLPATATAATVGTTKVYTPVTNNSRGVAQAYRFTAAASGQVDRLNVYVDRSSTAGQVEVGLYTGSASAARARAARCVISSPQASAWNHCSIDAVSVKAGEYYWVALLQP